MADGVWRKRGCSKKSVRNGYSLHRYGPYGGTEVQGVLSTRPEVHGRVEDDPWAEGLTSLRSRIDRRALSAHVESGRRILI